MGQGWSSLRQHSIQTWAVLNLGGPQKKGTTKNASSPVADPFEDYLAKEESTAGAHGVETRYPFLDRGLVQEFLWLSADSGLYGKRLMADGSVVIWPGSWAFPIERSVSAWVSSVNIGMSQPAMFTGADGSLQNQKVPETHAFWMCKRRSSTVWFIDWVQEITLGWVIWHGRLGVLVTRNSLDYGIFFRTGKLGELCEFMLPVECTTPLFLWLSRHSGNQELLVQGADPRFLDTRLRA